MARFDRIELCDCCLYYRHGFDLKIEGRSSKPSFVCENCVDFYRMPGLNVTRATSNQPPKQTKLLNVRSY